MRCGRAAGDPGRGSAGRATSVPLDQGQLSRHRGRLPPRFSYTGGASQRYSLLSAWITLTDNGETISLLHQIHVDNTP
jgi:MSHA biogenesis protein MshO